MDVRPESSPTAVAADGRPAGASQGSRGCLGCLGSGSLGCGAFLFGAILAVASFAPQLLGGWAARFAATGLTQLVDGRVTVGGAELSWSDDTRLREVVLIDEADRELLRGTLRGPSLAGIMGELEGRPPHLWAYLSEVHLGIDAARGLDLARVLRWQEVVPLAALWRPGRAGDDRPFLVSINAGKVHLVDTRDGRYELVLTDFLLDLERADGARATNFKLTCGVEEVGGDGGSPGSFDVSLHVGAQDRALPSAVAVALKAEDLPARAALLLLEALHGGFGADLPRALTPLGFNELAGGHLDLELTVSGDVQTGADVALSLASERGDARLVGRLMAGVLQLGAGASPAPPGDVPTSAPSEVRWQMPTALARSVLAPLVPGALEFTVLGAGGGEPGVRARIDSLVLDTGLGRGWDVDPTLVEVTADVPCELALTIGVAPATIVARDPLVLVRWLGPLGGSVTAHWAGEGGDSVGGTSEGATSGEATSVRADPLAASSDSPSIGSATVRFEPSLASDGAASTRATSIAVDVDLPGLSVELLRIAAALPAEAAALLGERVRLQVSGLRPGAADTPDGAQYGLDGRALDFALYAGVGRVPVRGRVEGGVARAAGGGQQSLAFPGDAATLARLLGPLLPWIDEFAPAGPGPVTVTFGDLAVPLDGGVLRPRGALEVSPPPLRVRLSARIAAYFGSGEATAWTPWHPRTIRVELNDEVVRYESIELPLVGDLFPFKGSFDRATRELNLQGEVPMRLVQDRDWGGSELAQQLADSDVPVFVNLSGPIDSPRLFIDRDQALGMLSRGLEQALDEVVPRMRRVLDQIVPRPTSEPAPAEDPRPARPPTPPGGG